MVKYYDNNKFMMVNYEKTTFEISPECSGRCTYTFPDFANIHTLFSDAIGTKQEFQYLAYRIHADIGFFLPVAYCIYRENV